MLKTNVYNVYTFIFFRLFDKESFVFLCASYSKCFKYCFIFILNDKLNFPSFPIKVQNMCFNIL